MSAENVHRYAFASADRYQRLTGAEQTTGFAGGRDLSANAITAIVWAKKLVPQELDRIMRRNKNVLDIFDNMTNPIPKWYR